MALIKQQELYKFSHQGTKAQRRDTNLTLYKKGIYARYRAYERNANTLSFKILDKHFDLLINFNIPLIKESIKKIRL